MMTAEAEMVSSSIGHGEPPVQGATWVEDYERAGVHVTGYWRGPNGEHLAPVEADSSNTPSLSLSKKNSGNRYVLDKNGKPMLSYETGKPDKHTGVYASEDQAYHAAYARKSMSLNEALKYDAEYADWTDKDPVLQQIEKNAFAGKRFVEFKTATSSYNLPVKTVRQSKSTKKMTQALRDEYEEKQKKVRGTLSDVDLAKQYASANAIEDDIGRLKKAVASESYSNVLYINSTADGGFQIQSVASVDKDALENDLKSVKASDAELNDLYEVKDNGYSIPAVRNAFNATLNIPKGMKGAPKARAAAWAASGLADDEATFSPDKDELNRVSSKYTDSVISSRFSDDKIASMSGSAKRAALCELGVEHQHIRDDIERREEYMRKTGEATQGDKNVLFRQLSKEGAHPEGSNGLKYKAIHRAVLHEKNVDAFVKDNHLDPKAMRKTSRSIKVDALKEFSKKHHMSAYKYLKPTHRVHLREMSDQRALNGDRVAARELH
jgi:hypothetical protein